jgi:hypothetical protein
VHPENPVDLVKNKPFKYALDVAQKSLQNFKGNMEFLLKPLLMNGQPKIWTEGIWSMSKIWTEGIWSMLNGPEIKLSSRLNEMFASVIL